MLSASAALTVFLMVGVALAGNIGTAAKGSMTKTLDGDYVSFDVLVWNAGDGYTVGVFPKSVPDGWIVFAQPEEFYLNSTNGRELISLPGHDNPTSATPVRIFVSPKGAEPGRYQVSVEVRSVGSGGQIFFSQGRVFDFEVVVPGQSEIVGEERLEVYVDESPTEISQPAPTGADTTPVDWGLLALVAIIGLGILAVSITIYRYA